MLMLREKSYSWYNLVHSTSQVAVVCAFIPEVGEAGKSFRRLPGLQRKFQDSQSYIKTWSSKQSKTNYKHRAVRIDGFSADICSKPDQSQKPTRKERIDSSKLSPDLHMCTVLWTCPTTHIIHSKCGGWSSTAKSANQFHFRSLHQAAHNHLSLQPQWNLPSLCQE